MALFDEYWEEYKRLPYDCKLIINWLENVGDAIQHNRIPDLNREQLYNLSIVIRQANATCIDCDCKQLKKR